MSERKFVTFINNEMAIAKLTNFDFQDEMTPKIPTIELKFYKKEKNQILVELWNSTVPSFLDQITCKIGELSNKLIGKPRKTSFFESLIEIFNGDSDVGFDSLYDAGNNLKNLLKNIAGEIYLNWDSERKDFKKKENKTDEQNEAEFSPVFKNEADFPEFQNSAYFHGGINYIFNVDKKYYNQAKSLLENENILNEISKVLSQKIAGRDEEKISVFIYEVQAFTPYFVFIVGAGDSSVGKSWLVTNTLSVFPPESYEIIGRMSKRALERINLDKKVKIIYVQEQRGQEQASDAVRLSSSSDGGMVAWVVNATSGEVDIFKVDPRTFITTTTNLSLHIEDSTRTVSLYIPYDVEQGNKVKRYQTNEAQYPDSLKKILGMSDPESFNVVQNAIRLLLPFDVIIPYMEEVSKNIDVTKTRFQRDHLKLIGSIYTMAWLHQRQRKWLKVENEKEKKYYIIAELDDFKKAYKYCYYNINATYLELDEETKNVFLTIKEEFKKIDWTLSKKNGIHTNEILVLLNEKFGKSRTWVDKRLERLIELSLISKEYLRPDGESAGNYYKPLIENSIEFMITEPLDEDIKISYDKYIQNILSNIDINTELLTWEQMDKLLGISEKAEILNIAS